MALTLTLAKEFFATFVALYLYYCALCFRLP